MTAEVTLSLEGLDELTAPHLRGLNQAPPWSRNAWSDGWPI